MLISKDEHYKYATTIRCRNLLSLYYIYVVLGFVNVCVCVCVNLAAVLHNNNNMNFFGYVVQFCLIPLSILHFILHPPSVQSVLIYNFRVIVLVGQHCYYKTSCVLSNDCIHM